MWMYILQLVMEKFKTTCMYALPIYVLYIPDMFLVMGCVDCNVGSL